jgi:hypothetical protein
MQEPQRVGDRRGVVDDARARVVPGPAHAAAHVAGRDARARRVPEPLHLARLALGEHPQASRLFGEPDGGLDGAPVAAERGQRHVALAFEHRAAG